MSIMGYDMNHTKKRKTKQTGKIEGTSVQPQTKIIQLFAKPSFPQVMHSFRRYCNYLIHMCIYIYIYIKTIYVDLSKHAKSS